MRPTLASFTGSALLLLCACSGPNDPNACDEAARLRSAAQASERVEGWRDRILVETEGLPTDTILLAGFLGPTAADSALFHRYGGRITYAFRGFDAVGVDMSSGGLRSFAMDSTSDPDGKIRHVEFGIDHMAAECR